ncbi:hypothetical protein FE391_11585 [Nonomuraea sp. KC401]|uniref:Secreted protein n=1 Tax=Nonomuraea longispora TaxID=1848320 RepID=A0A4R4NM97_9ACTN|nr:MULTISPECIES: hypothetical protein [Nonomuraea]NBE93704.1 hypothetical protein [Nonomuraea sp. K271]TDC08142.1 hypothetical protein E1267_11030 [Nonomuraea longispora]TLF76970.1 hypothetical protein FE391_11585 [Nonomuraea sp. KC401]
MFRCVAAAFAMTAAALLLAAVPAIAGDDQGNLVCGKDISGAIDVYIPDQSPSTHRFCADKDDPNRVNEFVWES